MLLTIPSGEYKSRQGLKLLGMIKMWAEHTWKFYSAALLFLVFFYVEDTQVSCSSSYFSPKLQNHISYCPEEIRHLNLFTDNLKQGMSKTYLPLFADPC